MELGNGRLPSLLGKLKFPIVLEDVTAEDVAEAYHAIREATIDLVAPLATEDYVVQSCPEASPPKWLSMAMQYCTMADTKIACSRTPKLHGVERTVLLGDVG